MIPNPTYHAPVLLQSSLDAMQLEAGGVYIDATFGGGGHSAQILARLGGKGRLFAFDQDEDAALNAKRPPFSEAFKFKFIKANFRYLKRMLRAEGVRPAR